MAGKGPQVYIAFRFHTNFYHSYRGDTPDELGFGMDIRVIRNTIDVLDRWNAAGLPVKGTWDIDNAFTLENIIPQYCPDIVDSLQRRVKHNSDEINIMVYNNGIISAHTAVEFDAAISKALHNENASGLRDIFPSVAPIVRPQEMMYTPLHLKLYNAHGIKALSLFYSGVPFNTFSNFIQPLPLAHRHNPLWLTYPGIEEKMALVPAYNHGDIADWLSLRRWIKYLHKIQMHMVSPRDFLLLIDADADDEYWVGYNIPLVKHLLPISDGLDGLIRSVYDLPFAKFTTPYAYLESHQPLATVQFGQDTADGSFDGYSSWADKWSNHKLWTGIERSRILELQSLRLKSLLVEDHDLSSFSECLEESQIARLYALSTTHFGLTAPILNQERLKTACNYVSQAVQKAGKAYNSIHNEIVARKTTNVSFTLVDYIRGVSTPDVTYSSKGSRALVQLQVNLKQFGFDNYSTPVELRDSTGKIHPACILKNLPNGSSVMFVAHLDALESKNFSIFPPSTDSQFKLDVPPVEVSPNLLQNKWISLHFDGNNHLTSLIFKGSEFAEGNFINSAVSYAKHISFVSKWRVIEKQSLADGFAGLLKIEAEFHLSAKGKPSVRIEHTFLLIAELPYLYLTTQVIYPYTESRNYNRQTARKLGCRYDNHWREVMPCELRPALYGVEDRYLRVWKHNYLDHTSYYDLDYSCFSKNIDIDAFNNHITQAWVAVTDQQRGLLVAQTADAVANMAFCPMRLRQTSAGIRIYLNPFGTYYGKQWDYPTAKTGIGKALAALMAPTLGPQAASYNGRVETIQLLIAPYLGDRPPESICADAEAFAYPYAVISASESISIPPHREWKDAL